LKRGEEIQTKGMKETGKEAELQVKNNGCKNLRKR
jgi:hypothetical protein